MKICLEYPNENEGLDLQKLAETLRLTQELLDQAIKEILALRAQNNELNRSLLDRFIPFSLN